MPTKPNTKQGTGTKPAAKASSPISTKTGVVESDKRAKTRTVIVTFKTMHPKYGKFMGGRTVLHIHDEANESRLGDTVEIAPCRPVSKTKRWRLVRVVERSRRVEMVV